MSDIPPCLEHARLQHQVFMVVRSLSSGATYLCSDPVLLLTGCVTSGNSLSCSRFLIPKVGMMTAHLADRYED